LHTLALRIGAIFDLDVYGLDVVETTQGPKVVDINDFPSFGSISDAEKRVATSIVNVAEQRKKEHIQGAVFLPSHTQPLSCLALP
jgi:ribosomal protein S6--L-glutamate ligase